MVGRHKLELWGTKKWRSGPPTALGLALQRSNTYRSFLLLLCGQIMLKDRNYLIRGGGYILSDNIMWQEVWTGRVMIQSHSLSMLWLAQTWDRQLCTSKGPQSRCFRLYQCGTALPRAPTKFRGVSSWGSRQLCDTDPVMCKASCLLCVGQQEAQWECLWQHTDSSTYVSAT